MRRKNFNKQQDDGVLRRERDDAATAVVSLREIRTIISRLGGRVRGRETRGPLICVLTEQAHTRAVQSCFVLADRRAASFRNGSDARTERK